MMRRALWPLLLVAAAGLAGCTSARGTMTAIDAAHRGVVAEERIVEAYHQAVMESFGHARAAHITEAKHIVDRLAAQEKLTAEIVKEGFDRLLANLDVVEARRAKFRELCRLARQNNANAKEALAVVGDSATLRRHDDPPDYISFREAAINLLIHQDYGDHTRKPVIKIFADRTVFWNPGDSIATVDQLLEPTEKEVRNPAIVNAFRRIGLSDQAGTGMRSIVGNWRQLGYVPPVIENDKAAKTFKLVLQKEPLLTDRQRLFQAQLGVTMSDHEAAVFAYACRSDTITITDAKAVTGGGNREAKAVLDRLVTMVLMCVVEEGVLWDVAEHLKERFRQTDQATDQLTNLGPWMRTWSLTNPAAPRPTWSLPD